MPDVYPHDFIVLHGKKLKVPKFYDTQYEEHYPEEYRKLKRRRLSASQSQVDNNTPSRLKVREKVQLRKLDQLPRPIERD